MWSSGSTCKGKYKHGFLIGKMDPVLLKEQVAEAATIADQQSAERTAIEFKRVETEKEKLDAAAEDGSSPFDVLFGG